VADRAVVNASPLIFLGKTGLLDLLHVEAAEIVVPSVVWSEVSTKGDADPVAAALGQARWLRQIKVPGT
jgi:hypothetical protein